MVINRGGPEERRWGQRNMGGIMWGCIFSIPLLAVIIIGVVFLIKTLGGE